MYRVGIVGAGFGERVHLPSYAAHPKFEVVAVASPTSAKRIAQERNIAGFSSAREMLAGIDVDVVSIASPPFSHHDDVLAALEARKHVLCEKPFALNLSQAEEMLAAAKAAGTACGVSHEFRYVPQRMAQKELVANGHLTPLREIEITQLYSTLRESGDRKNNWWFQREKGGGVAGALLSHIIDNANWLAGRPPKYAAGFLRTANPHRRDKVGPFTSTVDDGAFALLDYGDGLIGRLAADGTTAIDSFTCAVHAENRTAVASGDSITQMRLFAVDSDETSELDCKPLVYAKFASINENVPLFMELLDAFVRQIETGESALPTFDEALETQRVLAAIGYGA
ncbi:MAG: Gfo/Idh/MocA family oxidoreductase [Candidatus Baltobacteraceae bacterium]